MWKSAINEVMKQNGGSAPVSFRGQGNITPHVMSSREETDHGLLFISFWQDIIIIAVYWLGQLRLKVWHHVPWLDLDTGRGWCLRNKSSPTIVWSSMLYPLDLTELINNEDATSAARSFIWLEKLVWWVPSIDSVWWWTEIWFSTAAVPQNSKINSYSSTFSSFSVFFSVLYNNLKSWQFHKIE